jgi:hypothetical protein
VEIAAVGQQIGCAVALFSGLAKNHVKADLAGVVILVVPGPRVKRRRAQCRFQPEAAQHLHGVATDLDTGAEPGKAPSLLVNRDLGTAPP